MVSYYWSILRRIPFLLWTGTERVITSASVGLAILAFFSPDFAKTVMTSHWADVARHYAYVPIVFLAIWGLAKANYEQIRKRDDQIESLKRDRDEVTERLAKTEAVPDELLASHLKGLTFRLMDLAREENTIRNRVFEDCYIHGPAVVYLENSTVIGCSFEGDINMTLIVTTNTSILGPIRLERCTLLRCTFSRIGIIGPQADIDRIRQGFTGKPA